MRAIVDQHFHTSFPDIDRENRDGEFLERAGPDSVHGSAVAMLCGILGSLRKDLPIYRCVRTRMKLRQDLYRIADVAVFWPSRPISIPDSPPLIAIEVVSPEDRFIAVREKLQEYHDWGVPHVWLVDPYSHRFFTCDGRLTEVKSPSIPEVGITVEPGDIFK